MKSSFEKLAANTRTVTTLYVHGGCGRDYRSDGLVSRTVLKVV